jgi:hypothetical protein
MSSTPPLKTPLLRLPTGEEVQVHIIRTDSGKLIARTTEELQRESERAAALKKPAGGR